MRKRIILFVDYLATDCRVVDRDLQTMYPTDPTAMSVMERLEKKVSEGLYDSLNCVLLGFCGDMQQEIADDLLDFACHHIIRTTGCSSVDIVLYNCYRWIAEEQGLLDKRAIQALMKGN